MALGDSRRWGGLRIEPYKPDAVDADGDGIVQEGTIWERPKGTKFIYADTREDFRGGLDGSDISQLNGLILVDFQGREVQHKRSWEREDLTLGERLGTIGSKRGTVAGPPPKPDIIPPEAPPTRMSAKDIAELQREYPDFFDGDGNLIKEVRYPFSPNVFLAGAPIRDEIAEIESWEGFRDYLKGKRLVVFDTETSGWMNQDEDRDKILQLGAVVYEDGEIVDRFNSYVKLSMDDLSDWVKKNIPNSDGQKLSQDFLDSQPNIGDVLQDFFTFVNGDTDGSNVVFVAHNAPFDMKRIAMEHRRTQLDSGFPMDKDNTPYIDTMQIARAVKRFDVEDAPRSAGLNNLRETFGLSEFSWHTADADAEMTGQILWKLVDFLEDKDAPLDILDPVQGLEFERREREKFDADLAAYAVKVEQFKEVKGVVDRMKQEAAERQELVERGALTSGLPPGAVADTGIRPGPPMPKKIFDALYNSRDKRDANPIRHMYSNGTLFIDGINEDGSFYLFSPAIEKKLLDRYETFQVDLDRAALNLANSALLAVGFDPISRTFDRNRLEMALEISKWYSNGRRDLLSIANSKNVDHQFLTAGATALSPLRLWDGQDSANKEATERIVSILQADEPIMPPQKALDFMKYRSSKSNQLSLFNSKFERPVELRPSELNSAELGELLYCINAMRGFRDLDHFLKASQNQRDALNAKVRPIYPLYNGIGVRPVQQAIGLIRGEVSITEGINGPKLQSFYSNLWRPDLDYSSTNDTWHYRAMMSNMPLRYVKRNGTVYTGDIKYLTISPKNPRDAGFGQGAISAQDLLQSAVSNKDEGLVPGAAMFRQSTLETRRALASLQRAYPQAFGQMKLHELQALIWVYYGGGQADPNERSSRWEQALEVVDDMDLINLIDRSTFISDRREVKQAFTDRSNPSNVSFRNNKNVWNEVSMKYNTSPMTLDPMQEFENLETDEERFEFWSYLATTSPDDRPEISEQSVQAAYAWADTYL